MRLLMVSGDRQTPVGEVGPFHAMQREFSRHFERIDVVCPRPDRPVTTTTIHGNVHFWPADTGRLGMARYVARRATELVREHGHGLIVSHDYGWFYNGLGAARASAATGVPYLSELHHVPGHPLPADLRERFDKWVARRYVRWALDRAAAFRVVNRREMPPLLEAWGVPPEKIVVLGSLYIDLELFSPRPVEKRWDLAFVGRLVNNKGLFTLVDALRHLSYRRPPVRLLVLGRGPLRAKVEAHAVRRGVRDWIEFVDWVETPEDLADVYRASRAVVCASTCEGGPRVTVEGMACGTPAISTPVGIMGELLEDGVNGALARFDAASLAAAIDRVLGDEAARRAMGEAARASVEPFEYHRALRAYADGCKRLAERFAGGGEGAR